MLISCLIFVAFIFGLDALYFGGVCCTYWSLGESMKPGGKVNNFVVVAFCDHLFCRPDGHPDVSKRHYFFSNISVSGCFFLNVFVLLLFIFHY
jgi:hypothetical protein